MYIVRNKDEMTFRPPYATLTRIPGCCSAGLLRGISASGHQSYSEATPFSWPKDHEVDTLDKKIASLIGSGCSMFTIEGANLLVDWLLMWRVENSAHPYKSFKALKVRAGTMTKEPGRYFWPSKSWCMYDRTDVKRPESSYRVQNYGKHLEEIQGKKSGIIVVPFDTESVHAKGRGYTSFGSEKPHGYGTIRNWNINVKNVAKFREYLEPKLEEMLSQIKFTEKSEPKKVADSWS